MTEVIKVNIQAIPPRKLSLISSAVARTFPDAVITHISGDGWVTFSVPSTST